MAKRSEIIHQKTFNIAVVGLSGSEKEKGCIGIGKSCLCNRFVRPLADDYYTDHISVLSQTDFSGRVVNNDHWLYWGEISKTTDEGHEINFSVIEQTEFIDDTSFQPFKTGKTEPYFKRCAATRLTSAEKLMYICKSQLGIEKEYEQKYLNDGRFNVDGFVCVFDVSEVQGRTLEKLVEYTAMILNSLMKTKKPIVLATTKHDECNELYVREAERLVNRKEYRGSIQLFETSAHENVNVDLAFLACAQSLDRSKARAKMTPYFESLRMRKETLDYASDAYQSLIRSQVTDYRSSWNAASKKLCQNQEFLHYCDLFGQDAARMTFKRHLKKLKEETISRKMQMYIRVLPEVLSELLPDIDSIGENSDWQSVKARVRNHPDFDQYFVDNDGKPWQEADLLESSDTRIPFDLLDMVEAEHCFQDHKTALEAEDRRKEMRHQFKQLLQETGYVTPGKSFNEVRVLFMGRECYESLNEQDLLEIYEEHQHDIVERAKRSFQELLLEHSELFYHFASLGPGSVITQDDIFKITEAMHDDIRYKSLDRLEQDRTLMLLRHLGFIHSPIREHCPAYPDCIDLLVEKYAASKARRSSCTRNSQWLAECENNHLNLVLLGSGGLAEELSAIVKKVNMDFELEKVSYTLDFRIIDGDVDLPQNTFQTTDFVPQGCFCVYSNHQTLEYVRDSLEKTLLSNLEQEDRLPFHGLPIVILFAADTNINEKDIMFLREEGQNRAKSLQCPFLDVTNLAGVDGQRFDEQSLAGALKALIENIQRREGLIQIYQAVPEQSLNPDIRILVCMLCGDPFSIDHVLNLFINQQRYFVTSRHSITLDIVVSDAKRFVELIITSYHNAQTYRDELLHGFILVYSAKRKASLNTLSAFSNNIPNTPTQILAVSDNGNSNIYYSNHDSSQHLISEGNSIADKLQAHFATISGFQQKPTFLVVFLQEVWNRKPQIEKAFEMEDSDCSFERRTPNPPPVPSRQESFDIRSGSVEDGADSEGLYEQLPSDHRSAENEDPNSPNIYGERAPLSPSDDSDIYASVFNQQNGEHLIKPSQIKSRRSLQTRWLNNRSFDRNLPPGEDWLDNDVYHPYQSQTGHKVPPPLKPKPVKVKPGKLNLKQFDNITNAVGRLSLSKQKIPLSKANAPLATPENVDLPPDYLQDPVFSERHEYTYAGENSSKVAKIRSFGPRNKDGVGEKESDSDSDWSSLERRQRDLYNRVNRKPTPHKKTRRKRAIPVAPPKLPVESSTLQFPSTHCSSSSNSSTTTQSKLLSTGNNTLGILEQGISEDGYEISKDATMRQLESVLAGKSTAMFVEPEKPQKKDKKESRKDDKRRAKEEERQKKNVEKKKKKSKGSTVPGLSPLEQFIQSESRPTPLFVEKCILFIEKEGLDSEGIYRVPGNRAHVDLLFQNFDEDPRTDIAELDIPVNAVATALKDFFSKRLPPLIPPELMDELNEICKNSHDRNSRLKALSKLLRKLPSINFQILKFVFQHFVKVTKNHHLNSMDSKNLAICWWPTLLPFEFNDMQMFEAMRPHLEEFVQIMIDQFEYLFCDEDRGLIL